jgi:uncharacterized membrane protein YfhO
MAAPSFAISRTAVLDRAPQPAPATDARGTAQILAYAPNRSAVQVNASGGALLVLSEVFYPGWVATLDGVPTEIYRADAALRAVVVPAGDHLVEMVYQPVLFQVGAAVTLITLAALALALAPRRVRPRW